MKKVISLALALSMSFVLFSCKNNESKTDETKKKETTTQVETTTKNPYAVNPLTGIQDMSSDMVGKRPTAVMINNIKVAQGVQTGVGDADIVYETLVEGGITRLLAVFSDIREVGQLGTVRSARYTYAELAAGLDAHYTHCGKDEKYCGPLLSQLGMDNLDLGNNASSAGQRFSNGLASEHTLYTFGDKLYSVQSKKRTDIKSANENIYKFNPEDAPKTYEKSATKVKAVFSNSYVTNFKYDSSLKKYSRGNSSNIDMVDYKTGKKEYFTNVFLIYTDVYELSDGYHVKSDLDSGKGVYISNGTACDITWSKASSTAPLKFKTMDGNELVINAGNSYVCITEQNCSYE